MVTTVNTVYNILSELFPEMSIQQAAAVYIYTMTDAARARAFPHSLDSKVKMDEKLFTERYSTASLDDVLEVRQRFLIKTILDSSRMVANQRGSNTISYEDVVDAVRGSNNLQSIIGIHDDMSFQPRWDPQVLDRNIDRVLDLLEMLNSLKMEYNTLYPNVDGYAIEARMKAMLYGAPL